MCNCIEHFKKELKLKTGDNDAKFGIDTAFSLENGDMVQKYGVNCSARKKKKDGTLTVKPFNIFFRINNCPFCGEKLYE